MLELNHIYNMDCIEGMKQIPDKYFELAIVDPPYGKKPSRGGAGLCERRFTVKDNEWDIKPDALYYSELMRISKNQIIWGFNHLFSNLTETNCVIVWDKINDDSINANCELAWTSFNTVTKIFRFMWNGMLQQNMKNKEERFHPTQKPVDLYKWLLRNYAKQGDKILDTHMGSGSSIIACHDMGFEYMAFEIDKDYYEAATKRINEHKAQIRFELG